MDFNVEWHDRLGSTNAFLRERFSQGMELPSGTIVAAREQTEGRGRQARKWLSTPGQNLCFSLFIRTDAKLVTVPSLTMAAALAVNDLLRSRGILSTPKWPNDVLVGGKKICGILSERVERQKDRKRLLHQTKCSIASPTSGRKAIPRQSLAGEKSSAASGGTKDEAVQAGIIIGIGLNVNMTSEEAKAIDRPATSMLVENGRAHDLSKILEALFQPLEYWIGEWEKGGFPGLREIWTEKAGPVGKPLTVHDGDLKKNGTLAGFGDHGELLLKTKNGLEAIWSGDVFSNH
ncbi:MAG: biotin--[acetyl-CoA-carboxylase] ligase [Verrucomicrobia bacterium]|nr:biotin--[acetyl-CoA-carboxylase] ligase [Verrucomicrobiota bacterium]